MFQVMFGIVGLVLTGHGVRLLLTRRMSPFTRRRWLGPVDAGMYFLCGGLFFLLLSVAYLGRLIGTFGPATMLTLTALAITFLTIGQVRYRPRDGSTDVR
ncbi:hypothetical protein [Micromonospora endolithica]|uniref:hypothetical protein n=1 Tax=Micromonospora endolithica TaxID=230091 RepID=UPI0011BF62E0|nr:hypothetical protein [Micromonospora endolithica]